MKIIYKINDNTSFTQLDNLTENVGWGRRGEKAWKKILYSSSFVVSAWSDEKLVGLGRIVEDGIMCMVYDIAVHGDFQKLRIGTNIMDRITEEIKNNSFQSVGLFAWKENPMNIDFYSKFGFQQVDFGMKFKSS